MTATSSDIFLLEFIGQNCLEILASLVPFTLCYGLSLLLFFLSASTLIKRGLNRRPTLSLFILIVFSFILFTIVWVCLAAYAVLYIRASHLTVNVESFNGQTVLDFGIIAYKLERVNMAADRLMLILSDAIVIWRAWAFFQDQKWLLILPSFLLMGSAGTGFAYWALTYHSYDAYVLSGELSTSLAQIMFNTARGLSFLTNLVATVLILYKFRMHRRCSKRLGLDNHAGAEKIFLILVETGLLFLVLQLSNVIMKLIPKNMFSTFFFVNNAFENTYTAFTGMYPLLVVYLVGEQRPLLDGGLTTESGNWQQDTESNPSGFGSLVFARAPTGDTIPSDTFAKTSNDTFSNADSTYKMGRHLWQHPYRNSRGNLIDYSVYRDPDPKFQVPTYRLWTSHCVDNICLDLQGVKRWERDAEAFR